MVLTLPPLRDPFELDLAHPLVRSTFEDAARIIHPIPGFTDCREPPCDDLGSLLIPLPSSFMGRRL